jgi:hypothetical protein
MGGSSSFRTADGSAKAEVSSGFCRALMAKKGRVCCSAVDRNGEGGGNVGRGFEEGYAGGGCGGGKGSEGCDGSGGGGGGGASMVAMLDSEYVEWTVKFVLDAEGWWREREEVRGGNICAASVGAESGKDAGKDAQQRSSNASNGRKRSCESRDASRAGSNSKGSRE